jgi:hypothetical protein
MLAAPDAAGAALDWGLVFDCSWCARHHNISTPGEAQLAIGPPSKTRSKCVFEVLLPLHRQVTGRCASHALAAHEPIAGKYAPALVRALRASYPRR